MAIKFHWVLITYAKYQDTLYKENKTKLTISGCTYQGFFSCHKREKFLVHDNEVIVPGTVLTVYFFLQMIRANTNIVHGELIDGFCVNEVPALEITMNIDKIVLQDLIGSDIVPK